MNDNGGNTLKDQQKSVPLPGGLLGDVVAAQGAAAHHEATVAAPIRTIAGRLMAHADSEIRTMGEEILRHLEAGK